MRFETDAMNVKEAAEYLRIGTSQIRRLCALGCLPHVRLGKRMILHKRKIDLWVESNTKGGIER